MQFDGFNETDYMTDDDGFSIEKLKKDGFLRCLKTHDYRFDLTREGKLVGSVILDYHAVRRLNKDDPNRLLCLKANTKQIRKNESIWSIGENEEISQKNLDILITA